MNDAEKKQPPIGICYGNTFVIATGNILIN